MQIDAPTLEALGSALRAWDRGRVSRSAELEVRYTDRALTRQTFVDVLRYFETKAGLEDESVTADVAVKVDQETYRVTFESAEQMRAAMEGGRDRAKADKAVQSGAKADIMALHMLQVGRLHAPVDLEEYGLRLNVKSEVPVPDSATGVRSLVIDAVLARDTSKTVREKRRFSAWSKDRRFRYDFTTVRQYSMIGGSGGRNNANAFRSATESYEMEVEYVGGIIADRQQQPQSKLSKQQESTMSEEEVKRLLVDLLKASSLLLKVAEDTDHLISRRTKREVMDEYARLVGHRKGVSPKPVTLMRKHLVPDLPGEVSVLRDYTVTEKTDGEHRMLFVSGAQGRRVYLISDEAFASDEPRGISFTGLTSKGFANTLLDGEFVPGRSGDAPLFMCFDAYFLAGQDIRDLPLMVEKEAAEKKTKTKGGSGGGRAKNRRASRGGGGIRAQGRRWRLRCARQAVLSRQFRARPARPRRDDLPAAARRPVPLRHRRTGVHSRASAGGGRLVDGPRQAHHRRHLGERTEVEAALPQQHRLLGALPPGRGHGGAGRGGRRRRTEAAAARRRPVRRE